MSAFECETEVEGISSMVRCTKSYCRCRIRRYVPNLVALTLLEVVALSAAGLEEVGALLGVTFNMVSV